MRGDRGIWAAGIIYAVGRVNFLADPDQTPHMRTDTMAGLLGVKQSTMANKGRLIMDSLRIGLMDPEFSRHEIIDKNPMTWLLEVNGLLADARHLPEAMQVEAWRRGLIPYVPAHKCIGARSAASVDTVTVDRCRPNLALAGRACEVRRAAHSAR